MYNYYFCSFTHNHWETVQNVQTAQSMNATKLSKQPYTTKSTSVQAAILHYYSKLKLKVISHRK